MRPIERSKAKARLLLSRQRKLRVEMLEERRVLAAVVWDGEAGDGLWTSALNWSGDAVPGASDDVEIQSSPAGQVVVRGNVPNIGSLVNNGSLFLEGRVDSGAASLNILGNSNNFGTIRLETTSSDNADRGTYLNLLNNSVLTNAASGVIAAYAGTGNTPHVIGNVLNQGQIYADTNTRLEITSGNLVQAQGQLFTSTNGEIFKSGGNFEMTGGAVAGTVRVKNALVTVGSGVTTPSTIRLVGDNVLGGNQSAVTTLWLESSVDYGYSQLFVDANATNAGILRMESITNSGGDQNTYLVTRNGATFTNASSGIIDARLGAGDGRIVNGSIINHGVLRSDGNIDLVHTGHLQFMAGTTEGRVLFHQVQLDVASTSAQATLRVVGDNNVLINNLGTQVTVWLDGNTSYGYSRMFFDADAINSGKLLLQSTSDNGNDQGSYLDGRNGATLVNAAGGTIEARTGTGDGRFIRGNFLNEGTINSVDTNLTLTGNTTQAAGILTTGSNGEILQQGGNFVMTGGSTSGTVHLLSTTINVAASVTQPTTLRVVGDNSYLQTNLSTQTTLWLEGTTNYGYSRLYYAQNVTNFGTIRMESTSNNGNDQGSYLDGLNNAIFTNAAGATLRAVAGSGDGRFIRGNFANAGTVEALAGTVLSINGGNVVQAGGTWQTSDTGEILRDGGSFTQTGGSIQGRTRFINSTIDIAPSVSQASTLRLVGANFLSSNQSSSVTLWLEGSTTYGSSPLYVDQDAVNAGTIRMESTSDNGNDQTSYIITRNNARLTNASTGVIAAFVGAGDARRIEGNLINFGTLTAEAGVELLHLTGSLTFNGGSTSGPVRFRSVNVQVNSSATTPTNVRIVGDNNVLLGNLSSSVTLWLEGNVDHGYSRLFFDSNAVNAGAIRLESTSDNGGSQAVYLEGRNGAVLTNAVGGSINVHLGAGDDRFLVGNITNQGTIRTHAAARANYSGNLLNTGSITTDDTGEFLQTAGNFTITGGAISGVTRLTNTHIDVAATATQLNTLRLVGDNNFLVNNHSPSMTLWLEGTTAYGFSQLYFNANAVTHGNLRMESSSDNGANQSAYLTGTNGAVLTIGPTATLDVRAGAGDARIISGSITNQGTLQLAYPIEYSGNLINRGIISSTGAASNFAATTLVNEFGAYVGSRTPLTIGTVTNNGTIDSTTGAIVTDVQLYPNLVLIGFSAADGMAAGTVTNLVNYTLVRSGGDGVFGNGNDVDVTSSLSASNFDPQSHLLGLTINGGPLTGDTYLLTIAGSNLLNSGGEPLFTASIPIVRQVNSITPALDIDLVALSDSGLSSVDNLTNDNTPAFTLLAKTTGTVDVDFNGDGQADQTFSVPSPGAYAVTANALADGIYFMRATLTPAVGGNVQSLLRFQVDTLAPAITDAFPSETAPNTTRRIKFSETLDTTNLNAMIASLSMVGPGNTTVAISSAQLISPDTLEITYPAQTTPGPYVISIGQPLPDIAGNLPSAPMTDAFTLTATASWIGGSGDWSNPANWQGGRVPTSDHDVVINVPGDVTITVSSAITVKSLTAQDAVHITNTGSLTLTAGISQLTGNLTVEGSLIALNASTQVSATGNVTLTGASLSAENGATLAMTGAASYSMPAAARGTTLKAIGSNSILDLQNITQISVSDQQYQNIRIEATAGGHIDLRRFNQYTDPNQGNVGQRSLRMVADGTNSLIDMSSLTQLLDVNYDGEFFGWQGASLFRATNAGTLLLPVLQTTTNTEFYLDATGVMNLPALASVTGGEIRLIGGSRTFPALTTVVKAGIVVDGSNASMPLVSNINASYLSVTGGVTLALPAVTTFGMSTYGTIGLVWTATGPGSVLDLQNLTQISLNDQQYQNLRIEATAGGHIDLRRFNQFTDPNQGNVGQRSLRMVADGVNSLIDMSSLTQLLDINYDGDFFGWQGASLFRATNAGTLLLPVLQTTTNTEFYLDATGVMNLPVLTSVTGGEIRLVGGNRNFPALTTVVKAGIVVDGSSVSMPLVSNINASYLSVTGGVTLALPAVTTFGMSTYGTIGLVWTATGAGSVLDLQNLTQISLNDQQYQNLRIEATAGGHIDLRRFNQFTDPNQGNVGQRSLRMVADGVNSLIDMSSLTQLLDINYDGDFFGWQGASLFRATNAGTLLLPVLQTTTNTEFYLDATGVMNLPVLTSVTGGEIRLVGGNRNFPALTTVVKAGIVVDGSSVSMPLVSNINASYLSVTGGVTLALPAVTTFGMSTYGTIGLVWTATGAGSVLDLQNLTQISLNDQQYQNLRIEATAGGHIDLRRFNQFTDPNQGNVGQRSLRMVADGVNSLIDMSSLTQLLDINYDGDFFGWQGASLFRATNAGTLLLPVLQTTTNTEFYLDASGVMNLPALASVTGGEIRLIGGSRTFPALTTVVKAGIVVDGSSVSMPLVSNINASYLSVTGGVTLALPAVTTFGMGTYGTIGLVWTATGAGSVLDLQNLTQISLNDQQYQNLRIEATAGGHIDLRRFNQFTDPNQGNVGQRSLRMVADGVNSLIDMSSLTQLLDINYDGDFFGWQGASLFRATNAGTLLLPVLQTTTNTEFYLDATGVMNLPVLTSVTGGEIRLVGGNRNFPALTTVVKAGIVVDGSSVSMPLVSNINASYLSVTGGVTLALPAVTTFGMGTTSNVFITWTASGAGSVLDLQNLTQIALNDQQFQNIRIEATTGGRIDLHRVNQYIDPVQGNIGQRSIRMSADGVNSLIDVSGLTQLLDANFDGDYFGWHGTSSLVASNGGRVLASSLANVTSTEVRVLTSDALISLGTLELGSNSFLDGVGTIQGSITNSQGQVRPGINNIGRLIITGDYSQQSNGTTIFELAGPEAAVTHDQMMVGGALNLNGTLRLERLNGYIPTAGTAMAIIANAASRTGQFSILQGLLLPNNREFTPVYSNNGVTIATETSLAPYIIGLAPASPIPAPVSFVDVLFSKPIDPTTFTTTDVTLIGPSGPVNVNSLVRLSDVAFRATFDTQLNGTFSITVGPDILDFIGSAMDQNRNNTAGEPGDAFTGQFLVAPDLVPPRVLNVTPFGLINSSVTLWQVEFTEAMTASSFTVDDVTVVTPSGALPGSSISVTPSPTNNRMFTVTVPAQSVDGQYTLTLARDIRDLSNNQMVTPYTTSVILDTVGPRVQSVSVSGLQNAPLDHIDVNFSERLSSFTAADVLLNTPTGVIATGTPQWLGGLSYRIPFATQRANGLYTLRLGPGVRDIAGNDMSVGAGGGAFFTNFSVSLADLTIANGTLAVVPTSTTFGSPLTANWRLHNAGTRTSPATWVDQLWLSSDNQLDGNDRLLSTINQSLPAGIESGNSLDLSSNFTVPLDAGLTAGNYFIIVKTDANDFVIESNESNNSQAAPLSLSYPPLPDLIVAANSIVGPTSIAIGSQFALRWNIDNVGTATAVGGWTENIYLASSPSGTDRQLIGQYSHSGNLTVADPALARNVTLTMPEIGIGGMLYFIVEVDAARDQFESDENNFYASTQTTEVPLRLTMSLSSSAITEGGPSIEVTLTRNGSTNQPLLVTLTSNVANQLNVPAQVTIPVGQYSTRFAITAIDDTVIEQVRELLLTATAAAYPAVVQEIALSDNDFAALALTLTPSSSNEGSSSTARVTRNLVSDQPLTVALVADRGQVSLPLTVTIPANQAFVDFNISVIDDTLVEATATFAILASAADVLSATASLSVAENDVPTLALSLPATELPEGTAGPTVQATVSRSTATDRAQVVSLQSSNASLLFVPATVTIPAGATSATFAFSIGDDALVNGTRSVSLTAKPVSTNGDAIFATGNATGSLSVLDNDGPTLSLVVSQAVIAEGGTATLTIRRNTPTTNPLTVALSSSAADQLLVPTSAVIPAGSETVNVTIQGVNDQVVDGDRQVTVLVQSSGFSPGVIPVVVTDSDLPDLYVPSISGPGSAETGQLIDVNALVKNIGLSTAFGTMTQRVFFSSDAFAGNDVLAGQFDFTGPLLVNQTYSRGLSVRAPSVPGQYWLVIQADTSDTVREGLENNNTTVSALPISVTAAYSASVATNIDSAPSNAQIPLVGSALLTNGSPAAFVPVSIQVNVRGTKRTLTAITDADGSFATIFRPLPGEGGVYTVGAAHPGVTNAPIQDTFRLLGMKATIGASSVKIFEGGTTGAQIDITNLADVQQTGLQIQLVSAPSNLTVSAGVIGNATTLAAGATVAIQYDIAALNSSTILGQVQLRISTDQSRAGSAADLFITLDTTVIPLASKLELDRPVVTASMLVGEQTIVDFTVTNNGGRESGPLTLELPAGATWLSPTASTSLPSIGIGESTTISVALRPAASLPLTLYNGSLVLRGDTQALEIPFSFRAVATSTGQLQISVVDEMFYFTEAKPLVTTSVVVLRDPFTGAEILRSNPQGSGGNGEGDDRPGVSVDSQGRVIFTNIPAGPYELEVISGDHEPHVENIDVTAGALTADRVFVSRNFVRYNWTVEQVEVEDRTRVVIESVFETNVPAPVITVEGEIDLAELTTVGQTRQYNLKVTNHGLIAALDVGLQFGSHPNFRITPLVDTIGTLAAKTELTVPVIVTRIAGGSGQSLVAEGEDPAPCAVAAIVIYRYVCEDNVWKAVPIAIFNAEIYCPASGPITGVPGGPSSGGNITPRLVPVSRSTSPQCDCIEVTLFEMDVSEYVEPPLKVAESAINAFIASTGLEVELDPTAVAKVSTCCEVTPLGIGLEFSAEAGVDATVTGGPSFDVPKLSTSFQAADGSQVSVSGELFAGLEAYISAGIHGSITSGCDFTAVDASLTGSLTLGFRGGIDGTLTFTKSGALPQEQVVRVAGLVAGEVTGSISYSTSSGLQYCLDSEGVYVEIVVNVFGVQWSPFDDPNIPGVQTKHYFVNAAHICTPSNRPAYFDNESASFTKSLQERLGIKQGGEVVGPSLNYQPASAEGGSCAQVRLQISQDAVLTRTAFRASLELDNLGVTTPVQNLNIDISVYDPSGHLVTDLFTVLAPELKVIDKVDGTGTLQANQKGSATWMIYANREAAPSTAMTYSVGGVMRYTQNGEQIVIPMARVPITVLPDAELHLDYFLQRDVLADDPFTEVIEPSQPFSLAVMVKNEGAGIAKSLRLESAQPQIKENEKGLLIDFEILSSSVNGQAAERSLVAQLGNIGPGQLAFAQWQMLSSLQGLFVEYEARFEHLSGLGDNRLSLIKRVDIHELIRVVDDRQTGRIDILPDFLVNDLPDANDMPDTLYLSDGTQASVALGSNPVADGLPQIGDLQIGVTATMPAGWSYLTMNDPSAGNFKLVGVRRSDGTNLPLKNFWQTDRTFVGLSQRPVLENKIHLLDLNSTGAYTFIYSNGDETAPTITVLGSSVPNPAQSAVGSVDVSFSEPIDLVTFDRADIELRRNGSLLVLGPSVTVALVSGSNYLISGLSALTADDGVYELTVLAGGLQDLVGNSGATNSTVTWAKGQSAPAIVDILGVPQGFSNQATPYFDIEFTEPIDLSTLTGQDLVVQRNGNTLDLSAATFTAVGERVVRVGNVNTLLAPDGSYRITVNAIGILDLDAGLAGIGSRTATWSLDRTLPSVLDVIDITTDPRNTAVQRIDVQFSELIDLASFDVSDLTLTRDGGSTNLLAGDNRVSIAHLIDNVYRISGINWVQGFLSNPQVAQFTLTVLGSGIRDRAGNSATDSATESWTIDQDRPQALTNVQLTSQGSPVVNGILPSVLAEVSGTTAEAGLTIAIRDMTSDTELARQTVAGQTFTIPIRFPSPGNHQLRVRQIDAAGNTTDLLIDNLFVRDTPPVIESVSGLPTTNSQFPVSSLTVNFVSNINMSSFSQSDIRLVRNGGANLIDSGVIITPQSNGRSVVVSNLSGLNSLDGLYEFSLNLAGIASTTGILGSGTFTQLWKLDRVAPSSSLVPLAPSQVLPTFQLRINGTDPQLSPAVTGSGIDHYELHVSTDGGPFTLWRTIPADQPTADYTGRPNRTYAFRSIAIDAAGNREVSSASTTTNVPDLVAPVTVVTSLNANLSRVIVNVSGTDAGTDLRYFDVYVSVDGGDPSLVARVPAGTPDAQGTYSASLFYYALTDGLPHNYRIFTRGVDGSLNMEEAPGETKGLTFSGTYVAYPKLIGEPVFGDGTAQRSVIDRVTLTFDGQVELQTGAITLTSRATGQPVTTSASTATNSQGQYVLTLTFSGIHTHAGALNDGYYQLSIDGTKIRRNGRGLDIDGNGLGDDTRVIGASEADNYFALYGDVSGDGVVGVGEFGQFRTAFGKSTSQPGYDVLFDYERDGTVGVSDFGQFRSRFGKPKLPFA